MIPSSYKLASRLHYYQTRCPKAAEEKDDIMFTQADECDEVLMSGKGSLAVLAALEIARGDAVFDPGYEIVDASEVVTVAPVSGRTCPAGPLVSIVPTVRVAA